MPNFKTYIGNEKYNIGCTGQTIYVYDKNGIKLAKFKDLIYAYHAAISPNGDIFVVKTTDGRLGVYSLERLKLIKKFRFSKVDGAQDDNFCFSPDGKEFYNIERHVDSLKTALSIYETDNFMLKRRLLDTDHNLVLTQIEWDTQENTIYLSGFFRDKKAGFASEHFIGQLIEDELRNIRYESQHGFMMREMSQASNLFDFTSLVSDDPAFSSVKQIAAEASKHDKTLSYRWKHCSEK